MSDENVEIVRRGWEAVTRRPPDWSVVNALFHPDHVLETDWGGVDNTVYRGAEGFRRSTAEQAEIWDEWRHELAELIDGGGDHVVVAARLVARGKQSAIPVNEPYGAVVTVRDGKIVRTRAFVSVDDALASVGLPSSSG
jgi:ketosteroid isomerase-like protein